MGSRMRFLAAVVAILLSGACLQAQSQHFLYGDKTAERRWQFRLSGSVASADFSVLKAELMLRQPGLDQAAASRTVLRNFYFVCNNRLNQQRMMVPPQAQDVIDHMADLLSLSNSIKAKTAEGRRLAVAYRLGDHPSIPVAVVDDIGRAAARIRKTFRDRFLELGGGRVVLTLPRTDAPYAYYVNFLLEAERLQQKLENCLIDYFLSPEPGVVRAVDYNQGSIQALSKALVQLSEKTRERIGQ